MGTMKSWRSLRKKNEFHKVYEEGVKKVGRLLVVYLLPADDTAPQAPTGTTGRPARGHRGIVERFIDGRSTVGRPAVSPDGTRVAFIGHGGLGVVYRAWDVELERAVERPAARRLAVGAGPVWVATVARAGT